MHEASELMAARAAADADAIARHAAEIQAKADAAVALARSEASAEAEQARADADAKVALALAAAAKSAADEAAKNAAAVIEAERKYQELLDVQRAQQNSASVDSEPALALEPIEGDASHDDEDSEQAMGATDQDVMLNKQRSALLIQSAYRGYFHRLKFVQ